MEFLLAVTERAGAKAGSFHNWEILGQMAFRFLLALEAFCFDTVRKSLNSCLFVTYLNSCLLVTYLNSCLFVPECGQKPQCVYRYLQ